MDISEIWNNLVFLAAPAVALVLIILAHRIPRKLVRIPAYAGSILLFLIAGFVLFLDGCELTTSTARRPGLISPDGKHVVVVRWFLPGAMGGNYAHVSIRSRFSPVATEVESGEGDPPNTPDVRWLDNRRILISYWEKGQIKACSPGPNRVEGIEVLCQE
jgi:hypothetical protein